jgi:hypothetical protein
VQVPIHSGKPETPAERNVRVVREQGVAYPEALTAILRPFDQQTLGGPMPFAIVGGEVVPLASAVAKLRDQAPELAGLFDAKAKLDLRKMPPERYIAIRKHVPQLLGLRPKP